MFQWMRLQDFSHLAKPVPDVEEARFVCNIIHNKKSHSMPVVLSRDYLIPLLKV